MTDFPQRAANSWSERRRLIRFRRRKEGRLKLWQEFKLVPRWLIWTVVVLFLIAQGIGAAVNLSGVNGEIFPYPNDPGASTVALAGIITGISLLLAAFIFLTGYVNRDAKRRGMNSALWTFLVIVLWPAYMAVGFIIYFLMRQPLPYNCPKCTATVAARYNFCPNCKYNLHPTCPQCKQEVNETDKFCPYCAQDLAAPANAETPAQASSE